MVKFAGRVFKIANVLVVLVYLVACLIPYLPADRFWWIATLGLVFPLIFLAVLAFMLVWLIGRSRWWLLSFVALLLSWKQVSVFAGLNWPKEFTLEKSPETLRVMTWNISSWGETSKSDYNKSKNRPLMFDVVLDQKADVLCFQEFRDTKGMFYRDSVIPYFREAGYPYVFYVPTIYHNVHFNTGVVIFSKYPFGDTARFHFGMEDYAEHLIYADIKFNQKTIRMFTTHLQSVRFDQEEYTALRKIKQTDESGLKDSRVIVRKLKTAYQYRGQEADLVKQKIAESPYPVVVCGDFNDVPNSYTYFTVKGDLQDAFLQKGTGFGRTFQYLSPTLRIDYILTDKSFRVKQYRRIRVPYSDHYPVVTDLELPN